MKQTGSQHETDSSDAISTATGAERISNSGKTKAPPDATPQTAFGKVNAKVGRRIHTTSSDPKMVDTVVARASRELQSVKGARWNSLLLTMYLCVAVWITTWLYILDMDHVASSYNPLSPSYIPSQYRPGFGYFTSPMNYQGISMESLHDIYPSVILFGLGFWALAYRCHRGEVRRRDAVIALAKRMNHRSIGPIIDVARYGSAGQQEAVSSLIGLLPQLKSNERKLLNAERRDSLNSLLMRRGGGRKRAQLKCAILAAYEQIGDATAIPFVTYLAFGKGRLDSEVRDAAIACLPALKASLGRQHGSEELLRPSTVDAQPEATLMRPAAGLGEADGNELLRVANEASSD